MTLAMFPSPAINYSLNPLGVPGAARSAAAAAKRARVIRRNFRSCEAVQHPVSSGSAIDVMHSKTTKRSRKSKARTARLATFFIYLFLTHTSWVMFPLLP